MESVNRELISTKKYLEKLKNHYDVIDIFGFKDFDQDLNVLKTRLEKIKKETYRPNERIIIEHFDTDVYHERLTYGLNLYNFLEIIKNADIPFFTIILITNHFGIKKEINKILKSQINITVIETFLTHTCYNKESIENFDISVDKIKFPALSMFGAGRSHRFALYNYFYENNLLDNIEVSIRGIKNKE